MKFLNFETCDKCPACTEAGGGLQKVFCGVKKEEVSRDMSGCPFQNAEDISPLELIRGTKLFTTPVDTLLPSRFGSLSNKTARRWFGPSFIVSVEDRCGYIYIVAADKDSNGFLGNGYTVMGDECRFTGNMEKHEEETEG